MKRLVSLLAAMLVVVLATPAHALTYNFDFTGSLNASFEVMLRDDNYVVSGGSVFVLGVTGVPKSPGPVSDLLFWVENAGGGLMAIEPYGDPYIDLLGPQLFDFVNDVPVLKLGSFELSSNGGSDFDGPMTLTISEVAAVPEPDQWTMLIVGFGLVGTAVRRRHRAEGQTEPVLA